MSLLKIFWLYFHTLRHLKFAQVYGRLAFHIRSPKPDMRIAPSLRRLEAVWSEPLSREQSMLEEERFRFLNIENELPKGWNSQSVEKLWLYNLHYFDDLNARSSAVRRSWHLKLISRWIAENRPGVGLGWDPYPISLRVVNWIKWLLADNHPNADILNSLAVQLRFLASRLEFHLLGNHLLANAKALIFGGLFFEGIEAENWYCLGTKIMKEQLDEQILADGAHFERSPMYHSLLMEDLLDLFNLHIGYGKSVEATWLDKYSKMFIWLRAMTHPDGEIAFFNDAATGVAPKLKDLKDYVFRLGMQSFLQRSELPCRLIESGYARIDNGDAVMISDVGSVGPDYLPGHAHAGTLSFELSLAGSRVLVNSGTSVYGIGKERLRQRGTAAHNTLRLDEYDSSEVWSGFRVARRARTFDVRIDDLTVEAKHDGYKRLSGKPIHSRKWEAIKNGFNVFDELVGRGSHQVEVFFYIHPEWIPLLKGDSLCEMIREESSYYFFMHLDSRMSWRIEPSTWHPQFGLSLPNFLLVGSIKQEFPLQFVTRLSWQCVS